MMRALLIVLAFAACRAQSPDDVLERARTRLRAAAAGVPRYTCTETVDRSYYRETRQAARGCDAIVANQRNGRSKLALTATDRLRFDVEVADAGFEIYAWPGASRIANEKVEEMAGGGPLGSGPFGPFLEGIFANRAVEFQFLGQKSALLEYRYRVPPAASHYRVNNGIAWTVTGYDGVFLLDPATAELKQLTVRTLELPADSSSCEATTKMDFSPLRIGEGEYLIPRETHLGVIGRDAGFTDNATVYANCREFRGESTVRFDDAPPQLPSTTAVRDDALATKLPPGLAISLALESAIDTATAAAGDPISARIANPVVDSAKRVLMPAGTVLHGRITQMEHHVEGENYFIIGVSFDEVSMILDSRSQMQGPRLQTGRRVVTTESKSGFHGGGVFLFPARQSQFIVPRGYTSLWITIAE